MPNNFSFFDRWFGPGAGAHFAQRTDWMAQRWASWAHYNAAKAQRSMEWAAWKAEQQAQRQAWRAERLARKAEWRAQRAAAHWHHPYFGAFWGFFWTAFWVGFGLLMAFSPEFRTGFVSFISAVPHYLVRLMQALVGRAEV